MKISKLLVLGALFLFGNSAANAADWNVRTAPTVADVKAEAVEFEADHQYLLYNTGAKMFFSQGNAWGTRASGHADQAQALRMYFTKYAAEGAEWDGKTYIFKIYSSIRNTSYSWHECFFDSPTAMFVDRNSQGNFYWEVKDMGNKTYRLMAAEANPDYKSDGTQFVGYDENVAQDTQNLSDVYDNANAYPLSPMMTEGPVDWVFYDASIFEIYDAAELLKKEAEAAEAEGIDISAAVAVYNKANATVAEIEAALADVKTARQGNLANATADKPADATSFIVNPDFTGGDVTTGWSGTAFGAVNAKENAEHYEKTFDTYQKVEGLPNGIYAAKVNAFYRAGGAGDAYNNFVEKNEASRNAQFYVSNGTDTQTAAIVSPFKGAPAVQEGPGSHSSAGGLVIPNNMEAAEYYMHTLGLYSNVVFTTVEDGTLTIGVRKDVTISADWTIFDDFSLTYYGAGADAYQKWFDLTLDNFDQFNGEVTGVYTQKYVDDYNAVFEALRATKVASKDEVIAAVAGLEEKTADAVKALADNIALWKQFQELVEEAKSVVSDPGLDPAYTELLSDWYDFEAPDVLDAHELTNEELAKIVEEKTAEIDEARKHPAGAGTDMTNLLKNPDFTKGTEGWTIEKANGGNVTTGGTADNPCFEAWNNAAFDIYQVVENAPMGVYEISVQGFYRYGRSAYSDYLAQEVEEVKPGKAPVFIYMNDNLTSFTNVYGDPKQITDDAFYGNTGYASETGADGQVYYYPNDMASAAIAFTDGMYTQSAFGVVAKTGDQMRIGVKGTSNQLNDSWCIWDNFKLTFQGFDNVETVQPILEKTIAVAQEYQASMMGKSVKEALDQAVINGQGAITAGDGVGMFNALSALLSANADASTSIALFKQLETAHDGLAGAITIAVASDAVVAEGRALYDEIKNNMESYENSDAEAQIAAIALMEKKLAVPAEMSEASDDNPVDCTGMIVNPTYDDGNNDGWTISGGNAGFNSGVIECYNSNFDEYQELEGLPAGTYAVTVQGFYRFGSAENEYATFTENPAENNFLQLYVQVDGNETALAMPRLASDGSEEHTSTKYTVNEETGEKTFSAGDDLSDGDAWMWTWMTDPVVAADGESAIGVRIINGMVPVASAFLEGKFQGPSLIFKVGDDGKARIGLKKQEEKNTDMSWCIWDTWKLTYYGANSSKEPSETAISTISGAKVANVEFFNLNGARINRPAKGVSIMRETLSDGTVKVKKVMIR